MNFFDIEPPSFVFKDLLKAELNIAMNDRGAINLFFENFLTFEFL